MGQLNHRPDTTTPRAGTYPPTPRPRPSPRSSQTLCFLTPASRVWHRLLPCRGPASDGSMLAAPARSLTRNTFENCAPVPDDDADSVGVGGLNPTPGELLGSSMTTSSASEASPTISLPPSEATPMYFASPRPPSSSHEGKDLRLFVSATGLRDLGKCREACAIVYLRSAEGRRDHLSNVTASSADGPPPPPRRRETRTLVGQTEIAPVRGRDVEFSKSFRIPYAEAGAHHVVHVDLYACDARDKSKSTLIGVGEISVARVEARCGAQATSALAPVWTDPDARKKKRRGGAGNLRLAVEDVGGGMTDYRLDVQCEQLKRTRKLGPGRVRKAHYAVHTVASEDEGVIDWSLLFRSQVVEMVKKKKDGGSMEYNYFSSRPVMAAPGVIVAEEAPERGGGPLGKAVRKVKTRHDGQFFSLPSCPLSLVSPDARLRLRVYDDSGISGNAGNSGKKEEFLVETEFTIAQLREMSLGDSTEVKGKKNSIGQAALKFVEVGKEPKYFCLSIMMPNGK